MCRSRLRSSRVHIKERVRRSAISSRWRSGEEGGGKRRGELMRAEQGEDGSQVVKEGWVTQYGC